MNRKTGDVKWFQDEAFFIFHFLNAYEENGSLIVDGCRMESLDMTGTSFGGNPPLTWRWNLNLKDGSMQQRQIDDVSNEFPRFDERLAGRKHRYGYFAGGNPGSPEKAHQLPGAAQARLSDRQARSSRPREKFCAGRAGVRAAQREIVRRRRLGARGLV